MGLPKAIRHERCTMKILFALLASALLAGCVVVPATAPPAYYRSGPYYYYYPRRYYYYPSPYYYYYPGPYYAYPYSPYQGRLAPLPPPSAPSPHTPAPPPHAPAAPSPAPGPSSSAPAPPFPAAAGQPAPTAILRPIYFDLNKSAITRDAEETLKENLEWFRQNPGRKVRVAGNCDSKASGEYNLILGQGRADAAKKCLVGLGVDESLLKTVSYGNARPSCDEKDESCWAKERRVDFQPIPK